MRVHIHMTAAMAAVALSAAQVAAQDAPVASVTPYVAVGSDAASPVGTTVTIPLSSRLGLETDVAYRRAEGALHALSSSASLIVRLPSIGAASPYVAGGFGLARYGSPVLSRSGPPIGTRSRLAMTLNAGGGVTLPISPSMDLKTDARWFKLLGQGSDQFRLAQGLSFDVGRR